MKINIQVLGSTSAGNCTILWNKKDAIMIDCGFSSRYICQNLKQNYLDLLSLSGLLITHVHTDHVNEFMLNRLVKEKVPIFCHSKISRVLKRRYASVKAAHGLNLLTTFKNETFPMGSFTVQAFEVPHDSAGGCFGFNIMPSNSGTKKVTIATDLGYPDDEILPYFLNSDVIIIESNHDRDMLENSSRPSWLKKRIEKIGHLSNDQCAEFLEKILKNSKKIPRAIVLAHISQECNTNTHAIRCLKNMLTQNNYKDIEIIQTHKSKANNIVSI